jgi:hypothetical protein
MASLLCLRRLSQSSNEVVGLQRLFDSLSITVFHFDLKIVVAGIVVSCIILKCVCNGVYIKVVLNYKEIIKDMYNEME